MVPQHLSHHTPITVSMHTVAAGGRYYAAPQLDGLQPATWYTYRLDTSEQEQKGAHLQCFRTLDISVTDQSSRQETKASLRLVYGSCRKTDRPDIDALGTFASWLLHRFEQRETEWPHLLLLIGDQIYADEPSSAIIQKYPQLRGGARCFEDFALQHEYAWTQEEGVRQVLAIVPTFMIFDDHEILNDWNISPRWRAEAIRRG
ncbi:MAG TPA: alkaline phosphatase D family protein, partial [Ktedonobacteraceae bacterium]